AEERCDVARLISEKLARAAGPVAYILPRGGVEAWDRPGEPMHDPSALGAFLAEARTTAPGNVELVEIDAHINDQAFADAALCIFDRWAAGGAIPAAR
ncbi:MAG: Tm-1-like ATP-binding domain-containing protein, partial [Rhodoblastus sp.]